MKSRSFAIFILFTALTAGCTPASHSEIDPTTDPAILKDLSAHSPWSLPLNGVRCRILLDRLSATETTALRAAFVVENSTDSEVTLTPPAHGMPVTWMADDLELPVNTRSVADAAKVSIRLPAHTARALGPWDIPVPVGKTSRTLSATFHASGATLTAPPMPLAVAAAEWGPAVEGLRIRLSAPRLVYEAGHAPALQLFIHNTTGEAISLYAVNWKSFDLTDKRDLITFTVKTGSESTQTIAPGLFVAQDFPEPPLLAPGRYRLKIILDSPELSADHAPAWHGKLTSNELTLDVVTR